MSKVIQTSCDLIYGFMYNTDSTIKIINYGIAAYYERDILHSYWHKNWILKVTYVSTTKIAT